MKDIIASLLQLTEEKRCAIHYPLENAGEKIISENNVSENIASENSDSDLLLSSLSVVNATEVDTALALSWRHVFELVDRLADQLAAQGVSLNQGLALIGKNSLLQLLLYLAGLSLGARVMVVNPQFPAEKIARILSQNQMDYYLAAHRLEDGILPDEKRHIRYLAARSMISAVSLSVGKAYHRTSPHLWQCGLTMTLTSGSSGDPKAVVHDIRAHWQNAVGVNAFLDFGHGKSWLLSLPLYHVSGQGIVWRWLSAGARLHFSGADFYHAIGEASHVSLVPTQLQRYLAYLQQQQTQSAVRSKTETVLLGGAHIDPHLCLRAQAAGLATFSGYGMTEMASTVFIRRNDPQQPKVRLLQGRELCVRNEEIWLRGAGLAKGYWQNGKITSLLNSQGWYQTKDRGHWHDGNLTILGRIDNMFISGGENIQPEEVEAVLQQHPQIEQVVVLPLADVEFGHRPVAMLTFKQPFSTQQVAEVRLWLQDKLERFKQPVAYYPLPTDDHGDQQIKIARKPLLQALQLQQKG
ncbi:o-succinylbenzoate--CoA ligase [Pasteurella testudinis]|uniref:o-succinylbenzoate--CoA ligase n=1 Tax=Pasteurella testudinis TaxID=761 RepID=UPI0040580DE3